MSTALTLLLGPWLFAQTDTSSLEGRVTDPQRAAPDTRRYHVLVHFIGSGPLENQGTCSESKSYFI
jgi:hypothetical protein